MPSLIEALAASIEPPVAVFLASFLSIVAGGFLVNVYRHGRIMRMVSGTPTERIASATQGYTELHGKAVRLKGPEIWSPGGCRCVWYRTWHGAFEEASRDGAVVFEGLGDDVAIQDLKGFMQGFTGKESDELFAIQDGTGLCIIDPEGAVVEPSKREWRRMGLGMGHTVREHYIFAGDDLYVAGQFRTLNHEGVAQELSAEVGARIRFWKQERMPELVAEFDRNRDGELDPQEWKAVREKAIGEIEREYRQRAMDDTPHLIHAPDDGAPFIIAAVREGDYLRSLAKRQWQRSAVAVVLLLLAGGLLSLKGLV